MARRWTPDDLAYLHRTYGRYPISTLATRLHRTPKAIQIKANTIGLSDRLPPGHSPLAWAERRRCGNHWGATTAIIRAAKRDGVLRRAHHAQARPYIAPNAWIEEYLEQRYATPPDETQDTITRTWVPTAHLADQLGIPRARAADRLTNQRGRLKRLARFTRRVQVRTQAGQPLYWHPTDARDLVNAWRTECRNQTLNVSPELTRASSKPSTPPCRKKPSTSANARTPASSSSAPAYGD
jgi:hypothetical protein